MSAVFEEVDQSEGNRLWSMVTVPLGSTGCMEMAQGGTTGYSPWKDSPSRLQKHYESASHGQATGGERSDLHPEQDMLKWQ